MNNTFGLVGKKLGHSFSPEIHKLIGGYDYKLFEIIENEITGFLKKGDYSAINVTVPYKKIAFELCDVTDRYACISRAVNTVVKKDGKLYGYNTDIPGFISMLNKHGVDVKGKKALVLGTGGTSHTAVCALNALGADKIITVSRNPDEFSVSYSEAVGIHSDADIIINTTPCGMYPDIYALPLETTAFTKAFAFVDVIYNPLKTQFLLYAENINSIKVNGLYMLVSQAVRSAEIFTGKSYPECLTDNIYSRILNEKTNIVLTGMPGSGKTTVGKILSECLNRSFYDTDEIIFKKTGKTPGEIIIEQGESCFRSIERQVIKETSIFSGCVIATGGGAVLDKGNIDNLRRNGRIFFLDRPLSCLASSPERPLSGTKEKLASLYTERYSLYTSRCDAIIVNAGSPDIAVNQIKGKIII